MPRVRMFVHAHGKFMCVHVCMCACAHLCLLTHAHTLILYRCVPVSKFNAWRLGIMIISRDRGGRSRRSPNMSADFSIGKLPHMLLNMLSTAPIVIIFLQDYQAYQTLVRNLWNKRDCSNSLNSRSCTCYAPGSISGFHSTLRCK